jgi:hypothetical protein
MVIDTTARPNATRARRSAFISVMLSVSVAEGIDG